MRRHLDGGCARDRRALGAWSRRAITPVGDDPRAMDRMRLLLEEREVLYGQAHHVVDTSDLAIEDVAARIAVLVHAADR
jgi:hypothetical protein